MSGSWLLALGSWLLALGSLARISLVFVKIPRLYSMPPCWNKPQRWPTSHEEYAVNLTQPQMAAIWSVVQILEARLNLQVILHEHERKLCSTL